MNNLMLICGLLLTITSIIMALPVPEEKPTDAKKIVVFEPLYAVKDLEVGVIPAKLAHIPVKDLSVDQVDEVSKPRVINKRATDSDKTDLDTAAATYSLRKTRFNLVGYQNPYKNDDFFPTVV